MLKFITRAKCENHAQKIMNLIFAFRSSRGFTCLLIPQLTPYNLTNIRFWQLFSKFNKFRILISR